MKIEIWSDVMCPFCYIGKKRFEDALAEFGHKDEVEVEWKSFQLNPTLKTNPSISINDYLAETKGWQPEYAQQLNNQVTEMAAEVGLTYNMDQAVVANSFDAHKLIQFAKKHGLGDKAEEQLFKAYFTDGRNIADFDTLVQLGNNIGLDAELVQQALTEDDVKEAVYADLREAEELGIRAVPFFVFNRKYAISGAQPAVVFQGAFQTAWNEEEMQVNEGDSCDTEGNNC